MANRSFNDDNDSGGGLVFVGLIFTILWFWVPNSILGYICDMIGMGSKLKDIIWLMMLLPWFFLYLGIIAAVSK